MNYGKNRTVVTCQNLVKTKSEYDKYINFRQYHRKENSRPCPEYHCKQWNYAFIRKKNRCFSTNAARNCSQTKTYSTQKYVLENQNINLSGPQT